MDDRQAVLNRAQRILGKLERMEWADPHEHARHVCSMRGVITLVERGVVIVTEES